MSVAYLPIVLLAFCVVRVLCACCVRFVRVLCAFCAGCVRVVCVLCVSCTCCVRVRAVENVGPEGP